MKIFRCLLLATGFCLAMSVTAAPSVAQERLGDGAMGALAGALVGGPIGLVAGGIVGFTAGPSIASSWGLRHHHRRAHYRSQH